MTGVDKTDFIEEAALVEENIEDAEALRGLAAEVRSYLESHHWCEKVERVYFVDGFRYAAVFYAEIIPHAPADSAMFVIVGDIPPLYIDLESCSSASEALEAYIDLMLQICDAFDSGADLSKLPPLQERLSWRYLEPDRELIDMLRGRMEFFQKNLLEGPTKE